MTANARDVIARAIVDHESPKGVWNAYVASYPIYKERADAIIAALNDAGFEIVQRDAEPSDAQIDAAAIAMHFRNVMPVTQDSIDLFKRSDAWPVWRDQARAGLIAAGYGENAAMKPGLPPPGPSNLLVRDASPLPAPKTVSDQ